MFHQQKCFIRYRYALGGVDGDAREKTIRSLNKCVRVKRIAKRSPKFYTNTHTHTDVTDLICTL